MSLSTPPSRGRCQCAWTNSARISKRTSKHSQRLLRCVCVAGSVLVLDAISTNFPSSSSVRSENSLSSRHVSKRSRPGRANTNASSSNAISLMTISHTESSMRCITLQRPPIVPEKNRCPFECKIDAETAEKHRTTLQNFVNTSEDWVNSHEGKISDWTEKVDTDLPTCILHEHQEFVRSHFGIDVWTSNVRLPPKDVTPEIDEWKKDESQNSTVAYMTLPNNASPREDWLSGMFDDGKLQSGYAMPLKLGAVPTEASLRRFLRALSLLGLEVFIHPTQRGTVVSAPPDAQSSGTAAAMDGSVAD